MQYQTFGKSDLNVSRIAIGGLTFGSVLLGNAAVRVVHEAIDNGVTFFDTAESYNDGESERLIGSALDGGKRDKVKIVSKIHTQRAANGRAKRLSRANILESIDGSLKRLGTDHVDLYFAHHPDPETPFEETFSTFDEIVKQGKVRHVGLSNHYGWHLGFLHSELDRRGWTNFIACQHAYSILDRQIEQEIIPFCHKLHRGLMAYEPYAQGLLTRPYHANQPVPEGARNNLRVRQYAADPSVTSILPHLPGISAQNGLELSQLAILWLLAKPILTSAILGGDRPEHFQAIYKVIDRKLPETVVREIDRLSEHRVYSPYPNQSFRDGPAIN
jgi:aryl-alcohol dehydrogenase-like predicted oxidoreductase